MEKKEFSQHDKCLLKKIKEIDNECGYTEWPTISSLANQLEDEEAKAYWKRQCSHYNHMEEASIGEL